MDWNAEVVDQLETHWHHQPRDGPDPVTTIAWRLAHVVVGFAETNGTPSAPASVSTYDHAGTADDALRQLDREHDRWIEGVRGLGTVGLAESQGSTVPPEFADAPMARLVLYTNLEVIHHGAEICLLRDVYLREGAPRRRSEDKGASVSLCGTDLRWVTGRPCWS